MIKDKNQGKMKLNKDNIFEDDLSSLSFGIFSHNLFSNNLNINDNMTFNDSYGNISKESLDLKFPDTFNPSKSNNNNIINYKRIYPDEVGQEIQCQMKIKNKKTSTNNNTNNIKKICDSYDELKKLISKYSFFDVVKIIIQLTNNMKIEGDKDILILEQLQTTMTKFNNKNDIILLLLSVLNDKFSNEENKEDTSNNLVIYLDEENSNESNDNISNDTNYDFDKNKYEYIMVLKKYKNFIHSYKLGNASTNTNIMISCLIKDCKAFCHVTINKIYSRGKHNHKEDSKSIARFESLYPELVNNPSWKYARILKYNGKEYIKLFY